LDVHQGSRERAITAIRGMGLLASGRKVKAFPANFRRALAMETRKATKLFEKSSRKLKEFSKWVDVQLRTHQWL
jgi:hypothetical protein